MFNQKKILGLGSDIIEISRISKAVHRHKDFFIQRIFTEKEIEYCQSFINPMEHYAGKFAAKEAIVKALGTGFSSKISFKDIEIINSSNGAPEAHLSIKVKNLFGKIEILLTISHSKNYALAVALILNK